MSGHSTEEVVKSAVPLADLGPIDEALRGDDESLRAAVKKFRPADLGRDLSRRSVEEGRRLFEVSEDRRASAMLRASHRGVAAQILGGCDPAHAARSLAFMPTDDQAAILSNLEPEERTRIQEKLDPEGRKELERMMAFPESAVGRLMSTKIFSVDVSATVGEAMEVLRRDKAEIEVASNCYVVDTGRLAGVIPLRNLAVAPLETPVTDMMTRDPITVSEATERGDAAEIIRTHEFLSLPVVDAEGKLLGAVRVDDLLGAALSKVGKSILNQGGVAGDVAASAPYFQTSLFRVVRSRITWLVLLFVAETATGTVLRHFEDELAKVVALSFFIPLLIGTGGNAGSQTVSTIIRALALGEVRLRDVFRVLAKEITTGFCLGVLLGCIAFGRALLWGVSYDLAACVGVTVLVVCTWANTVGAVIPLAAQRVGVDPTVVSGPLITTLVDASGLFLYLTIAKLMIAQLRGG